MSTRLFPHGHRTVRARRGASTALAIVIGLALVVGASSAVAGSAGGPEKPGKEHWKALGTKLPPTKDGAKADVKAEKAQALRPRQRRARLHRSPRRRPRRRSRATSSRSSSRCPTRTAAFQRFALHAVRR